MKRIRIIKSNAIKAGEWRKFMKIFRYNKGPVEGKKVEKLMNWDNNWKTTNDA